MSTKEKLALTVKALREIADPIGELKKRLKPGEKIDGGMAVALANSASNLRGIASGALYEIEDPVLT